MDAALDFWHKRASLAAKGVSRRPGFYRAILFQQTRSEDGWTPLHYAVYAGLHRGIKSFLRTRKALKSSRDKWGRTPLHIALLQRNYDIAKVLVENGVDVHEKDETGASPLHAAVMQRDFKMTQLLLDGGADPGSTGSTDRQGWTPLHLALVQGEPATSLARLLIRRGADVRIHDKFGWTPLHLAVVLGNTEMVSLLLENGAEVEGRDEEGRTPLHQALKLLPHARNDFPNDYAPGWQMEVEKQRQFIQYDNSILQLLLNAGADTTTKDNLGQSAMQIAYELNNVDAGRLLWEKSATTVSEWEKERLECTGNAAMRNDLPLLWVMLNNGKHPDTEYLDRTALEWACSHSNWNMVELLISWGADPSKCATNPLLQSVVSNNVTAFGRILEVDSHTGHKFLNTPDSTGRSPLHVAAERGQVIFLRKIVDCLDSKTSSLLNLRDSKGMTALHIAAEKGHYDAIEALLRGGANAFEQDNLGRTPVHVAVEEAHELQGWPMKSRRCTSPKQCDGPAEALAILLTHERKGIDVQDSLGRTPIWIAAEAGCSALVKTLLSWKPNLLLRATTDLPGQRTLTPLAISAINNHGEIAEMICRHNRVRINRTTAKWSAIELALFDEDRSPRGRFDDFQGRHLFAELLVGRGTYRASNSPPSSPTIPRQSKLVPTVETLRTRAWVQGQIYAAWFIDAGKRRFETEDPRHFGVLARRIGPCLIDDHNINAPCLNGQTPLQVVAAHYSARSLIQLLNRGANINFVDSRGHTALHAVLDSNKPDPSGDLKASTISKLFRLRARPDVKGSSPLLPFASYSSKFTDLLLRWGSEKGAREALQMARRSQNRRAQRVLEMAINGDHPLGPRERYEYPDMSCSTVKGLRDDRSNRESFDPYSEIFEGFSGVCGASGGDDSGVGLEDSGRSRDGGDKSSL